METFGVWGIRTRSRNRQSPTHADVIYAGLTANLYPAGRRSHSSRDGFLPALGDPVELTVRAGSLGKIRDIIARPE